MSFAKWFRVVRRTAGLALIRAAGAPLLRLHVRTWRFQVEGRDIWDDARKSATVICLWHGDLLAGLGAHRSEGLHVLVSPSGDGELIATVLPRMGYRVIRGSSNKRAVIALKRMLATLAGGEAGVVITPDGPRGPRHSAQDGVGYLARSTGLPLVAIGFAADRAWHFRSWDRFALPKWRARIGVVYARVPVEAEQPLSTTTRELESALRDATRRAHRLIGSDPQ